MTLTRAVPPGASVRLQRDDSDNVLEVDGAVAATAVAEIFPSSAPGAVAPDEAEHASQNYPGFAHHFFPRCFTGGPQRSVGEGLRIFPGPLEGQPLVAGLWRPPSLVRQADGNVASEYLWGALDCPAI